MMTPEHRSRELDRAETRLQLLRDLLFEIDQRYKGQGSPACRVVRSFLEREQRAFAWWLYLDPELLRSTPTHQEDPPHGSPAFYRVKARRLADEAERAESVGLGATAGEFRRRARTEERWARALES